jgi:hypothetical protein
MEKLHKSTERLPTVEVDNKVIWTNKSLRAPFDIPLASVSSLGVLLATEKLDTRNREGFPGLPREHHGRTLDVGQVYFEDVEHRLYRDVDMKGTGLVASTGLTPPFVAEEWYAETGAGSNPTMDVRGLLDKDDALRDAFMAEEFSKLGIRTHRALAVLELNELTIGSEVRPVLLLKLADKLHADFNPVIEVRAFGSKTRAGDLFPLSRPALVTGEEYVRKLAALDIDQMLTLRDIRKARHEIEDTLTFLTKEQKRTFTKKEYIEWFVHELGKGVGLMHNAGYAHQWLHSQNITLDARLTDFDSVYRLADLEGQKELSPEEIKEDQETLIYNDINFNLTSNRIGVLAWLEAYGIYLKKLYPEELQDFDTAHMNAEFLAAYWQQLIRPELKETTVMFMEGSGFALPKDASPRS